MIIDNEKNIKWLLAYLKANDLDTVELVARDENDNIVKLKVEILGVI
jgi:hypothetical protein